MAAAGARASAITRMQIGEFKKANAGDDGVKMVNVINHKTFAKFGAAQIPFIMPNLYKIANKYLEVFQEGCAKKALMFTNSKDNEFDAKDSTNWLKKKFMSDMLSPSEMKNFTPRISRHAWANWVESFPDEEIGKLGARETTRRNNYVVHSNQDAVRVAKAIPG